jgi:D-threo-aldose 1-dehydrogenase
LQRLGTNRIDVALVHDIDRWTHGDAYEDRLAEVIGAALPALQQARDEGVIGAIGIGVNEIDACRRFSDVAGIDCFMLAGRYTLLEREGSAELFAACARRGISILAAAPFNSGILATGATPEARYNYLPAPPEVRARVAVLEGLCAKYGVSLAAAALQFPLREPAVAAVVAGCRSQLEAEQSLALLAQPIPAAFWSELSNCRSDVRIAEAVR